MLRLKTEYTGKTGLVSQINVNKFICCHKINYVCKLGDSDNGIQIKHYPLTSRVVLCLTHGFNHSYFSGWGLLPARQPSSVRMHAKHIIFITTRLSWLSQFLVSRCQEQRQQQTTILFSVSEKDSFWSFPTPFCNGRDLTSLSGTQTQGIRVLQYHVLSY